MSRIIVTRHRNGEEHIVCGWGPLESAFVDVYDDEGECLDTYGPMSGDEVTPAEAAVLVANRVRPEEPFDLFLQLETLLLDHRELGYPESNVVVDLTKADAT